MTEFRRSLLCLLVCACGADAPAAYEPPGPSEPGAPTAAPMPERAVIEVAASVEDLGRSPSPHVFDVGRVDDLLVRVRFQRDPPLGRSLALELYSPRCAVMTHDVQPVDRADVVFFLAVSGTDIGRRALTGTFLLVAAVQGESLPVALADITFTAGAR